MVSRRPGSTFKWFNRAGCSGFAVFYRPGGLRSSVHRTGWAGLGWLAGWAGLAGLAGWVTKCRMQRAGRFRALRPRPSGLWGRSQLAAECPIPRNPKRSWECHFFRGGPTGRVHLEAVTRVMFFPVRTGRFNFSSGKAGRARGVVGLNRQPGVPATQIARSRRDLPNVLLDLCLKPRKRATPQVPKVYHAIVRWVSRRHFLAEEQLPDFPADALRRSDTTDRLSSTRSSDPRGRGRDRGGLTAK